MKKHRYTKQNLVGWGAMAILAWILVPAQFWAFGGRMAMTQAAIAIACCACWGAWSHISQLEKENP